MKPLRRRSGNQHLHRASPEYRDAVRRKLHAYHVSSRRLSSVRDCFSTWPSPPAARLGRFRLLAAHHPARHPALGVGGGQCPAPEHAGISPEFRHSQHLAKFVIERQDTDKMEVSAAADREGRTKHSNP